MLFEILNRRKEAEPNKYSYILHAFLEHLSDEQKKDVIKFVSEILKLSNEDHDFRLFPTVFQGEKWTELESSSRLRAENKLIKSFERGFYDSLKNRCSSGALGTWLSDITDNLKL